MAYDFDKIIDRRGTGSVKYEMLTEMFGREDLIPLWVADMDFETPPFIMDALRRRLEHPVLGYSVVPTDYWQTVAKWIEEHHQWKVETEWMTYIPGIVKGIGMVVNVFVAPDEKVIIQPPVYHPFRLTPLGNHREVVYNPLVEHENGSYSMDFENLEKVCDEKCRVLILCNPHNPAGIVWDRETLVRLAAFCAEHHLLVVSDEIHCDMALFGNKHVPFASVSEEAAQCSITFGAPSKTFNIAGVVSSWAVVPNAEIRKKFFGWLEANEQNFPHLFAPIATMAALKEGETWRQEMIHYLEGNVELVERFCQEHLPQIKALRPQASYLVWLDCRGLGLNQKELNDLFINKAHLALNDGETFGKEGRGFMRLNVGMPRTILQQALEQLKEAVNQMESADEK